jgi:hypothetical protein
VLFAALRVSSQTESIRPFGATEIVPIQCHLLGLTASSLIRMEVLKLTPPLVLRANLTSAPPEAPVGRTLASM